jgi:hypothetical protein
MKRNATATIFVALCVVYLMNISLLIFTMSATPQSELLPPRPRPPANTKAKDRRRQQDSLPAAALEIPVYTRELAAQAIRPAPWTCGNPNDSTLDPLTQQKPMFAFVHIYKTAGSTIRNFFQAYAYICRKGWMCLIGCTKVKSSTIRELGTSQIVRNWDPCRVKSVLDRERIVEEMGMDGRTYLSANNTILRENIDILGGHFRIGTGDYILTKNTDDIHPIRHIVFVRDAMERFVSGILYERSSEEDQTLAGTVALIKKRVRGSRAAGDYWDKSLTYLLTPGQAEEFGSNTDEFMKATSGEISQKEQFAMIKAKTAMNNMWKYNVIVGMTERMEQSMEILKYVFLKNADSKRVSELDQVTDGTEINVSKKGEVSTSSVLDELKKDTEFISIFQEYVKFEKLINDYAMNMHLMQYEQMAK